MSESIQYKLITNNRHKESGVTLEATIVPPAHITQDRTFLKERYSIVIDSKKPTAAELLKNFAISISNIFAKDIYGTACEGWDVLLAKMAQMNSQGISAVKRWQNPGQGVTSYDIQDNIFIPPKYAGETITNTLIVTLSKDGYEYSKEFPFNIHHWPATTVINEAKKILINNDQFLYSKNGNNVFTNITIDSDTTNISSGAIVLDTEAIQNKINDALVETGKINVVDDAPVEITEYEDITDNIDVEWKNSDNQVLTPAQTALLAKSSRTIQDLQTIHGANQDLEEHRFKDNDNFPIDYYQVPVTCSVTCNYVPVDSNDPTISINGRNTMMLRTAQISLVYIAALINHSMNPHWFIPRAGGVYGYRDDADSADELYSIDGNTINVKTDKGFVLRAPFGEIKELVNANPTDSYQIPAPSTLTLKEYYSIPTFAEYAATVNKTVDDYTGGVPLDYYLKWPGMTIGNKVVTGPSNNVSVAKGFASYKDSNEDRYQTYNINVEITNSSLSEDKRCYVLNQSDINFFAGDIDETTIATAIDGKEKARGYNSTEISGCKLLYFDNKAVESGLTVKYTITLMNSGNLYDSTSPLDNFSGHTIERTFTIQKYQEPSND